MRRRRQYLHHVPILRVGVHVCGLSCESDVTIESHDSHVTGTVTRMTVM